MTLLRLKYKNAPFSLLIKKVKKENVIKGVGIFWNAMEWKIDGVGIPRGGGEPFFYASSHNDYDNVYYGMHLK